MSRVEGPRDGQQRLDAMEREISKLQEALFRKSAAVKAQGDDINAITNPGAFQGVSYANSFSDFGSGRAPVAYYIDEIGRVFLRGSAAVPNNGTRPLTIFTLPVGYRPGYTHIFPVIVEFAGGLDTMVVSVNSSGLVRLDFGGNFTEELSLDSVQFRVGN